MTATTDARVRFQAEAVPRGLLTVAALRARCTVDGATHCWLWQGACSTDGSPRLHTFDHARGDKRSMSGPKAVWNIAHAEAPPLGKLVFRGCGQRACLNPAHLRLARTKAEIGEHWRRAGWRVGTALEARRANVRLAQAAAGVVPTDPAVVRAVRAAPQTVSSVELARLHGIAPQTVSRIRRGKSHRDLIDQPTQETSP